MQLKYFVSGFRFSIGHPLRRPDKIGILLIIALAMIIGIASCKQKKTVTQNTGTFYTCSMHPQIMEPHPGKCPICGMNLIAVQKSNMPQTDEIKLSDQQIQLGNIQVDTIVPGYNGHF
jgi:Cu(I)/Ag(I) efflux system membrane fusion protein